MPDTSIDSIDLRIGQRIRRARRQASITQSELGRLISRSSQQVHKYEQGSNRVSAGTLFEIARVLDRAIDWFFQDAAPEPETYSAKRLH